MSNSHGLIIVLILVLVVCYSDKIETFVSRSSVCADDGRCYKVASKYSKYDQAGKILADINIFCIKLLRHLRNKYVFNVTLGTDSYQIDKQRTKTNITKFLLSNYNPDGIIENDPKNNINTSYVEDKGKIFALCLREKTSGQNEFHKMEELEFVVIHEMAHMANEAIGHETDFWTVFKFLLKEAELAGLHIPVNYERYPMNYCSLVVDYSPYFDDTLVNL
jgi:hypothetical protein